MLWEGIFCFFCVIFNILRNFIYNTIVIFYKYSKKHLSFCILLLADSYFVESNGLLWEDLYMRLDDVLQKVCGLLLSCGFVHQIHFHHCCLLQYFFKKHTFCCFNSTLNLSAVLSFLDLYFIAYFLPYYAIIFNFSYNIPINSTLHLLKKSSINRSR